MATTTIHIPANTWTLVSATSVRFQVQGQSSIFIIESASAPAAGVTSTKKTAAPGKMYVFERVDGNFYAYSPDRDTYISTDPVTT